MSDDELLFTDKDHSATSPAVIDGSWKILIVDDEPEIHRITKLSLNNFIFENKNIAFLHAYSASEDAFALPLTTVFKIVNADTPLTVDNPVEKVLATGTIIGLAKHTILNKPYRKIDLAQQIRSALDAEQHML